MVRRFAYFALVFFAQLAQAQTCGIESCMSTLQMLRDQQKLLKSSTDSNSRTAANGSLSILFQEGNFGYEDGSRKITTYIESYTDFISPDAKEMISSCLNIAKEICTVTNTIQLQVSRRDDLPGSASAQWIPPVTTPNADPHLITSWPHWSMVADFRYFSHEPEGKEIWVRVDQGDSFNTLFNFGSFATGGNCMPARSNRLLTMSADVKAVVHNRYSVHIYDNSGCNGAPLDSISWELPIRRN